MKLTTALLATAGLAAAAPTAFPPKPIDTPFVLPGELEEPKDFHGPAIIQPVEPVGNPTPAFVPEKPVIPENATLDEVKEYIRQWADNKRLHNELIDWDDFHASFPHGPPYWGRPWPYIPPYWLRAPVAKRADVPEPIDDPEKPVLPENATQEQVREYLRQMNEYDRLHPELIDWDDLRDPFHPHPWPYRPPYWLRAPVAKRADAPLVPAKTTDKELKKSIQPKDENGKPYHLWDDRFPWITRFGKRAEESIVDEQAPPGFPPKLTAEELMELFRPSDLDGEPSPEWIPEERAVPKNEMLDFLKANPHMHVMSVKPIAKRTDGPEDYDLTEEEDLERDMCHVTLWDAMSGQWPEKVWECYEWHHLEDDGWNAGAWELD